MKHFNFLIIAAAIVITGLSFGACSNRDNNKSDSTNALNDENMSLNDENTMLRDSLNMARDYMNSLSVLVNEVSDGMSEIKRMEQIVSTTNLNAESATDQRTQLRNDIILIKNSIQDRQNRLAELENKLTRAEANNSYNEQSRNSMLETIANLKKQLTDQQTMIDDLTAKLDAANSKIKNLNIKVDSLNTVNTNVSNENRKAKEENKKAKEEIAKINNTLNECFYAIGSKSELKNHKIIETGFLRKTKVMQNSNIMHSYFTKADKRTLNEINLHSKKAKVLTTHDKQSYSIDNAGAGMKVLRIHDQERFWQYSNYLVVQVD